MGGGGASLATPISPAAWRPFSGGDIFLVSGVPGSCPEVERCDPPEALADSFLPSHTERTQLYILLSLST